LKRVSGRMGLIIATGLLSVIFLSGSCTPTQGFDNRLKSIVKPYRFSIAKWEFRTIPYEVNQWIFGSPEKIDDEVSVVTEYFRSVERIKTLKSEIEAINAGKGQGDLASLEAELNELQEQRVALDETVERILGKQIKEILAQQGIFNPIVKSRVNFPPLIFKLEKPPRLLVVSPRERIESIRRIPLQPGVNLEEMEAIEAEVDKLGVSSLVASLVTRLG